MIFHFELKLLQNYGRDKITNSTSATWASDSSCMDSALSISILENRQLHCLSNSWRSCERKSHPLLYKKKNGCTGMWKLNNHASIYASALPHWEGSLETLGPICCRFARVSDLHLWATRCKTNNFVEGHNNKSCLSLYAFTLIFYNIQLLYIIQCIYYP